MVGVLIRLKLASLRHALRGGQSSALWTGWTIGAVLALITLGIGVDAGSQMAPALDRLAIAFLAWAALWILVPLVGGASDPLRVETFTLLPIRPGRLAVGLLVASLVGVLPAITAVAFAALVVAAAVIGPGAALLAGAATLLLLGLVVAGSKVAGVLVSRAVETRVGLEIAALVYALLVAATWLWIPLAAVSSGATPSGSGGSVSDAFPQVARLLPTGWGIVAVEAVQRDDWLLAFGAVAGLAAVAGGLLIWWSRALASRLQGRRPGVTAARESQGRLVRWLVDAMPSTPIGATTAKELRAWIGQPRRRVQLRVPIWTAVLLAVVPGLLGATWLWPFAGIIAAWAAGVTAADIYGYDGTGLWLTLTIPGSERADVRGRQAAWLIVFGTTAVVATVVLALASGQAWSWPWVAAALPATIGACVGLVPLVSLALPAPLPDSRGGDPMDLGDDPRTQGQLFTQGLLMTILVPFLVAPVILITGAASTVDPRFGWSGVLLGIAAGTAYGWWLGALAIRRLRRRGPELLERMRARPAPESARGRGSDQVEMRSWVAILVGTLLLFPQGLVPLVLFLSRSDSRLWFLPLYLPPPWPIPAVLACIGCGIAAYWLAWRWWREAKEAGGAT